MAEADEGCSSARVDTAMTWWASDPYAASPDAWLPPGARPINATVEAFDYYYYPKGPFAEHERKTTPTLNPDAIAQADRWRRVCKRWPGLCEGPADEPPPATCGGYCADCARELFG